MKNQNAFFLFVFLTYFFSAAFTLNSVAGQNEWTEFSLNFESYTEGLKYTYAQAQTEFGSENNPPQNFPNDRAEIKLDPVQGKYLAVLYPPGVYSEGVKFRHSFQQPADWAKLCYDLFVPRNFDFRKGGKLHGLGGASGIIPSGGYRAGTKGFSVRIAWGIEGELIAYIYHAKQIHLYGDKYLLGRKLERGKWNAICLEAHINTPKREDGWIIMTLNRYTKRFSNFLFRADTSYAIDTFLFSTFFGGGDPSFAPIKQETLGFDNFTLTAKKE